MSIHVNPEAAIAAGVALPANTITRGRYAEIPAEAIAALRHLRREATAEVERLLALLDRLDGEWDLEDGFDDEPLLGWCGVNAAAGLLEVSDFELDLCDLEPDEDGGIDDEPGQDPEADEPSLGWTAMEAATGRYPDGWFVNHDLEEQCDDEGVPDNEDGEAEAV